MNHKYTYPFSAIVGQNIVKKALLINLVNPAVGGVLISGEKGTGKSTIVRGLGNLIQAMDLIELPLNITEDRLIGSIDIEKALTEGKRTVNNSLLMRANGNILYVDEINLLSNSIINALVEVSQSGINRIEREGISTTYESSFVLIGTMNPEEGGIRSQLLDRFGLYVEVSGSRDLNERINVIKRRIEYEENPSRFIERWKCEDYKIWDNIKNARKLICEITVSESMMKLASEISMKVNCSGHRAELIMIETSKAIAALNGRKNITIEDLKESAELVLSHRKRETSPNMSQSNKKNDNNEIDREDNKKQDNINEQMNNNEGLSNNSNEQNGSEENNRCDEEQENKNSDKGISSNDEIIDDIGNLFKVKFLDIKPPDRRKRKGSGRRSLVKTTELQGRYTRSTMPRRRYKDIAFDATFRAAAPYQNLRDKQDLALVIKEQDIREKIREKRTGTTILFVVDASGSMGAKKRMEAVKGAIMSLLNDAYQKRDNVGMVAFRKDRAELILNITRSVDLAYKKLKDLPTGGKTPLSQGLNMGYEILKSAIKRDKDTVPVLVLVSDGRGNVSIDGEDPLKEAFKISRKIAREGIQSIVIDTEQDFVKLKLAQNIANEMRASYSTLEDLKADNILNLVKDKLLSI
ncbi:MAG: magnesium chelatase subunit D family protein [Tissierellia bacterium]|nr:magnesium chelatase subunit D family protein [Tissierellia bacterium]